MSLSFLAAGKYVFFIFGTVSRSPERKQLGGRKRWSLSRTASRWSVAAEGSGRLRGPIHVNAQ
jgi:hypothetical protein